LGKVTHGYLRKLGETAVQGEGPQSLVQSPLGTTQGGLLLIQEKRKKGYDPGRPTEESIERSGGTGHVGPDFS